MDLGSGMNTQKTIQQLLNLERIPIKRMEEDNAQLKVQIDAWEEVRNRTRTLLHQSTLLFSFAGPFSRRSVVSSDPGAVTGEAAPGSESLRQEMEILALAGRHQFHSDPIDRKQEIKAGTIVIRSDAETATIKFDGGSLATLLRELRSGAAKLLEPSTLKMDRNREMLVIRSNRSGKKGELFFEDRDGVLQSIGLLKQWEPKEERSPLALKSGDLKVDPASGNGSVEKDGVHVRGTVKLDRTFDADQSLTFKVGAKAEKAKKGAQKPVESERYQKKSVILGPDISVKVGDIKLKGYQIQRELNIKEKTGKKEGAGPAAPSEARVGIAVEWDENGKRKRKVIALRNDPTMPQSVNIGDLTGQKKAEALYLVAENGTALFTDFETVKRSRPDEKSHGLVPAHLTEEARDARLKVNGVEITRGENEKITDLIEGASLNLHKITQGTIVVETKANEEEIQNGISEWVKAYNELLKFCRDNSRIGKPEDFKVDRPTNDDLRAGFDQLKLNSGIFASDSTIRQLETTLRLLTANAYPSSTDPAFRVLSDIGVSTGDPNQSWEEIKNGFLIVDEKKLNNAITTASPSVKELFASDTNEDSITDNGIAFQMKRNLEPYVRISGGIIAARINLLKDKITSNKERITQKELGLKKKEETLRRKFGRMESSIRASKATGNYLKSQIKQE